MILITVIPLAHSYYEKTSTAWVSFNSSTTQFTLKNVIGYYSFFDGEFLINNGEIYNEYPLTVIVSGERIKVEERQLSLKFRTGSSLLFNNSCVIKSIPDFMRYTNRNRIFFDEDILFSIDEIEAIASMIINTYEGAYGDSSDFKNSTEWNEVTKK